MDRSCEQAARWRALPSCWGTPRRLQTATLEPPKTLGVLDLAHALRGKEAVQAIGQGQIHYFYRRGADVFWVAADPPVAREVIARLLRPEP